MGTGHLKTRSWILGIAAVLLGASLVAGTAPCPAPTPPDAAPVSASQPESHAAGFGGVLVPRRVRIIIGFVQTLST
jgi:hypothetical protein